MEPALSIVQPPTAPTPEPDETTQTTVKAWLARIARAKDKWQKDFDRMIENQAFVTGIQLEAQAGIRDERYIVNCTLQMLLHNVANLYARNPEIGIKRRPRMDFALWEEDDMDSLAQAYQTTMATREGLAPVDMMSEALVADHMHGRQNQRIVDKICETLQHLYDYNVDISKPEFKEQMKQLVTRVITCGVGYVRPQFIRNSESPISTVETRHTVIDRQALMQVYMEKIQSGQVPEESEEMENIRSLFLSIGVSQKTGDEYEFAERLEFDFIPASRVIPDENCRALREFVGARWVTIEYDLPLDEVNAVFGTSIKADQISQYPKGDDVPQNLDNDDAKAYVKFVTVYEIFDYTTKTSFFLLKGYNDYLRIPNVPDPCVSGFWPLFALVFNHVEIEQDQKQKGSIFPPSDVDLILHPQLEWNRTQDARRGQRNANAPTYLARKGVLTEKDKETIRNREPNQIIELEGIPADMPPQNAVGVLQVAPMDEALYSTDPQEHDMQVGVGMQQANMGPAEPDVTATVGTIAEQSRQTVSSSKVDDLDGFLTRLAKACIEMSLRGFSEPVVKQIVGPGAVWPSEDKGSYLNMLAITVKAASSGKPNQAINVRNRQMLMPLLQQAGANPLAIIKDLVRVLDENIEVEDFFPIPGMPPTSGQQPGMGPQPPQGNAAQSMQGQQPQQPASLAGV